MDRPAASNWDKASSGGKSPPASGLYLPLPQNSVAHFHRPPVAGPKAERPPRRPVADLQVRRVQQADPLEEVPGRRPARRSPAWQSWAHPGSDRGAWATVRSVFSAGGVDGRVPLAEGEPSLPNSSACQHPPSADGSSHTTPRRQCPKPSMRSAKTAYSLRYRPYSPSTPHAAGFGSLSFLFLKNELIWLTNNLDFPHQMAESVQAIGSAAVRSATNARRGPRRTMNVLDLSVLLGMAEKHLVRKQKMSGLGHLGAAVLFCGLPLLAVGCAGQPVQMGTFAKNVPAEQAMVLPPPAGPGSSASSSGATTTRSIRTSLFIHPRLPRDRTC